MEVVIRPIPNGAYVPSEADAIACTYDMDDSSPMNAVLLQLGLDREYFRKCASLHAGDKFRVISHGDEKPFVITTTQTESWDSEAKAVEQILSTADIERCESLCMTLFALIPSEFPEAAFAQCLRQVEQAQYHTQLKRVVVDVDARYVDAAKAVYQQVKAQVLEAVKR